MDAPTAASLPTAGSHPTAASRPARRFISWTALAMMTVGSVGYLGSAPATSVFGLASVFLYVLPALVFLVPVVAGRGGTGLGVAGRRLQLGERGHLCADGVARGLVPVRPDDLLLPGAAGIRGQHARVRDRSAPRQQRLYTAAIIVVLFWGGVLVSSRGTGLVAKLSSSGTLIGTLIPGAHPRRPGVDLPGPGQSFGGADGRAPRPAGMDTGWRASC